MNKELILLKSNLTKLNSLNIEEKLFYLHRYTEQDIKLRDFLYNLTLTNNFPKEVVMFTNYLLSLNDFFIVSNLNNQFAFRLIKKDFSLYIEIAISLNTSTIRPMKNCKYNLEIFFIISHKNHTHVGSDFLKNFLKFQNQVNIPIVIYCSNDLISFYKKFNFKLIRNNSNNEYLMIYGLL